MDIVLIPTFNRHEMLNLCLEQIENAAPKDVAFMFAIDYGHDRQVVEVIDSRLKGYEKIKVFTKKHGYNQAKLSYNILEGYKRAAELTDEFVFMIEDDVMIGKSFFDWHRQVQSQKDLFCSVASKNPNRDVRDIDDEGMYYTSDGDYASIGICYRKEVIQDIIAIHANASYYGDMFGYIGRVVGFEPYGKSWPEQAGMIRRLQLRSGKPIAFPYIPRAFHAGYYGKNRGRDNRPYGTIHEKSEQVREIAFNYENLKKAVKKPQWAEDSKPCSLEGFNEENLIFDTHYKN